jgi:hypothetical protein
MLYIFNPIPHGWWTKRAMLKLRPRAMRSIKRIAKYLNEEGMPFGPSIYTVHALFLTVIPKACGQKEP